MKIKKTVEMKRLRMYLPRISFLYNTMSLQTWVIKMAFNPQRPANIEGKLEYTTYSSQSLLQ